MRPAVVGIAGLTLTPEEHALFRRRPPAGVILFARNVTDPEQLVNLTTALHAALPANAVIMVDQEGGRVARLRPPTWLAHPAAGALGALDPAVGQRAAWLTGALIGLDCGAMGFDTVCAPVLDLQVPGAHCVVGDRSYGKDPNAVAALGQAMADGLLAAGMQPVGKHAPGHGRATVDSHLSLPYVDDATPEDIQPFAACRALPWLMTAHIVYRALDPDHPATLSQTVIHDVIRGRIGFAGVLASDDLAMHALSGGPGVVAAAALAAGCDIALHCSGVLDDSAAVLEAAGDMPARTRTRLAAARALVARRRPLDPAALAAERATLLSC